MSDGAVLDRLVLVKLQMDILTSLLNKFLFFSVYSQNCK